MPCLPLPLQTAALAVLRWQEEWAGLALYAPAIGAVMTVLTR